MFGNVLALLHIYIVFVQCIDFFFGGGGGHSCTSPLARHFFTGYGAIKHEVMIAANVGAWEESCVCFVDAGLEA